jgi:hypothetical protein
MRTREPKIASADRWLFAHNDCERTRIEKNCPARQATRGRTKQAHPLPIRRDTSARAVPGRANVYRDGEITGPSTLLGFGPF